MGSPACFQTKLTRRQALQGGVAVGVAALVPRESSAATCQPYSMGQFCRSSVAMPTFLARAAEVQHQSMWCWAACTSMIFRHHGYDIPQEQIVEEEYGGHVNLPAFTGWRMTEQLDREWTTADGRRFRSELNALFDLEYNTMGLNNEDVVEALDNNQPLLVGTLGHAVVQTGFDYFLLAGNLAPQAVTVFDPWPNRGLRILSPAEMSPNPQQPFSGLHYVAWAKITPLN